MLLGPARARSRLLSQRGQDTVEWGGVLLLIAAIVAVVIAIGLPGTIAHELSCAVQRVLGDHAACQTPVMSNVIPCPTSIQTDTAHEEVQVLFVKAGKDNTLIKTLYSDGSVDYTLVNDGTLQAQAQLVKLEAQAGGAGFDVQASLAAGGELQGSYTFSFPNKGTADAFANKVNSAGGWGVVGHDLGTGVDIATNPVGFATDKFLGAIGVPDSGVGGIVRTVFNPFGALVHAIDPGPPSGGQLASQYKKYLTGGYISVGAVAQLNATASASAGPGQAELDAALEAGGGARFVTAGNPNDPGGPQKGDVQIYVSLSGNADASLAQQLLGPQANASAEGNAVAIVTLGPSGQPKQLEITADGNVGAGGGVQASKPQENGQGGGEQVSQGSGGPSSGELSKLNLSTTAGSGAGYTYDGTLNLQNDPAAVQSLTEMLNPATAGAAVPQIAHDISTAGKERVQPYQQTRSDSGFGLEGEVLDVGGGAKADVSTQNQQLQAGWVKSPGGSWQPVICAR